MISGTDALRSSQTSLWRQDQLRKIRAGIFRRRRRYACHSHDSDLFITAAHKFLIRACWRLHCWLLIIACRRWLLILPGYTVPDTTRTLPATQCNPNTPAIYQSATRAADEATSQRHAAKTRSLMKLITSYGSMFLKLSHAHFLDKTARIS